MSSYISGLLLTPGLESRHHSKLLLQLLYFELTDIPLMLFVSCLFLTFNDNDNRNDNGDDFDFGPGMGLHALNPSTRETEAEAGKFCEYEVSLVDTASSILTRASW